jgi:hypothetical protein
MGWKLSDLERFALNLCLLVALGVLVCWWFLHYTSLFPAIGGLLGLGGVLAWAAFVSGLITKERKAALQEGFEQRVLLCRATPFVLFALGVGCATAFSFFGSIEIGAIRDVVNRTVRIYPSGADPGEVDPHEPIHEIFMPARGSARFALRTRWLGSRTYRVKLSGLPAAEVEVESWRRRTLTAPDAFLAPVLLVWPNAEFSNQLRLILETGSQARLTFRFEPSNAAQEGFERSLEEYAGEAVWVGDDIDLDIPPDVLDQWSRTVAHAEVLERWRSPRAVAGVRLHPGQRVEVRLEHRSGAPDTAYQEFIAEGLTVRPVARLTDLPQNEVLDEK